MIIILMMVITVEMSIAAEGLDLSEGQSEGFQGQQEKCKGDAQ